MQLDQLARRNAARAQRGGELRGARESIDRHAGILARREFRSGVAIIRASPAKMPRSGVHRNDGISKA
jgi:hypothetical protein